MRSQTESAGPGAGAGAGPGFGPRAGVGAAVGEDVGTVPQSEDWEQKLPEFCGLSSPQQQKPPLQLPGCQAPLVPAQEPVGMQKPLAPAKNRRETRTRIMQLRAPCTHSQA